ncbi:MAG: hypothetical protein ACE5OW_03595 [Candidatus Bathyarchaeia archaeon]
MRNAIRRALTKTVQTKKRRIELPPSEHIVYLITFSIYAFMGLTALEVIHMLYFKSWNSEVFSAITGLIGTITGVFLSQRA